MKLKWNTIYWIMTLVVVACIQATAEPFAVGPYLGQTPPGSTAQVFAPGLICDTRPHQWEAWGTFSADNNTFCYNRLRYVYVTENTEQGWIAPKRIESIPARAPCCCLSPDANSVFFMYSYDPSKRYCLHRCMRTSQGWSLPQELATPLRPWGAGFSVAADHSICFFSERGRFWIAPVVGNTLAQAIKIPVEKGNLKGCHPGIAPDASFCVPSMLGDLEVKVLYTT